MGREKQAKQTYATAIDAPGKGPWYDWLASDEGKRCAEGTAKGNYLENRLWYAFTAGMKARDKQVADER